MIVGLGSDDCAGHELASQAGAEPADSQGNLSAFLKVCQATGACGLWVTGVPAEHMGPTSGSALL